MVATSVLTLLAGVAAASPIAPDPYSGFGFDVNYCEENGLWDVSGGTHLPGDGQDWFGTTTSVSWQQVTIESSNSGTFMGNGRDCGPYNSPSPWDTLSMEAYGPYKPLTYAPFGGFTGQDGSSTTWRAGSLLIHKLERWGAADDVDYRDGQALARSSQALVIDITVANLGCEDDRFYFMHAVRASQEWYPYYTVDTCNDTVPSGNFAFSEGPMSGVVIGYGRCDEDDQLVGHTQKWDTVAVGPFLDANYAYNRYAQHINHYAVVPALESVHFTFIFVAADSKEEALKRYYLTREEVCCEYEERDYILDADYLDDLGSCVVPPD